MQHFSVVPIPRDGSDPWEPAHYEADTKADAVKQCKWELCSLKIDPRHFRRFIAVDVTAAYAHFKSLN